MPSVLCTAYSSNLAYPADLVNVGPTFPARQGDPIVAKRRKTLGHMAFARDDGGRFGVAAMVRCGVYQRQPIWLVAARMFGRPQRPDFF
jgi:hypothetical protein